MKPDPASAAERGARRSDDPPSEARAPDPCEDVLEESPGAPSQPTQLRFLHVASSATPLLLAGLFAYATVYTLYFGRQLLLPVTLACLLAFVLGRPVRYLEAIRIPRAVSAVGLLLVLLSAVCLGLYFLSGPGTDFVEALPRQLEQLETRFRGLSEAAETARKIDEAADNLSEETPSVRVRGPGIVASALGYAQAFGAGLLVMVVLLVFLLSLDEPFLSKVVEILPTFHDKKLAVEIYREIERDVSRYLGTLALINAGLGAVTAGAMAWIGVPNPILWGVVVAILNFVLYLGPLVAVVLLAMVGLTSFTEPAQMVLPPLIFLSLNLIEAYLVTPLVLGRRLRLNPVAIFLAIAFWGFIWGVPGMLLAVPLLVVVKLVSEHIEALEKLTRILSY